MNPRHPLWLIASWLLLGCSVPDFGDGYNPNDPRVSPDQIPTGFHGYPQDLLFVSGNRITRMDGKSGETTIYDHETKWTGRVLNLTGSPSGRYAYFQLAGHVNKGPLYRLHFEDGRFEPLFGGQINAFTILDDEHLFFSFSDGCPFALYEDTCTQQIVYNATTKSVTDVALTLKSVLDATGTPMWTHHQFSVWDGHVIAKNLYRREGETTFSQIRIWFRPDGDGVVHTRTDTVRYVSSQNHMSTSGRFMLRMTVDLHMDDLVSGTSRLIAPNTIRISSYGFSPDERYVVIRVRRSYSNEMSSYYGHYLYDIQTDRLLHLFNKANTANHLRFSPDMRHIVFIAQFKGFPVQYLVSVKPDNSDAVIFGYANTDLQFIPNSE